MPYVIPTFTLSTVGLAYLLLIKPARNQGQMDRFLHHHYAHRGLHDLAQGIPENSLTAFTSARDAGYGIELDVQITKEGTPVVFHDYSLARMCGVQGNIKDMSFAELQTCRLGDTEERIPTFCEVLRLIDGRVPLIIELKGESMHTEICSQTHHALRNYGGDYVVESFNPLYLRWWRQNAPEVLLGQLSSNLVREGGKTFAVRAQRWLVTNLLSNAITRPDFIAYNWQDTSGLSYRLCRYLFKATTVLWTIADEATWQRVKQQCDAVIFEGFLPVPGTGQQG